MPQREREGALRFVLFAPRLRVISGCMNDIDCFSYFIMEENKRKRLKCEVFFKGPIKKIYLAIYVGCYLLTGNPRFEEVGNGDIYELFTFTPNIILTYMLCGGIMFVLCHCIPFTGNLLEMYGPIFF